VSLSPDGASVLFYRDGNWHLFDVATSETRNLTAGLEVSFANEDHDYPSEPPGYGHSEWLDDSSAILVYDKYDIWQVYADGSAPICISGGDGRKEKTVFRVVDLDPEEEFLAAGRELLLEAYHDLEKHDAFYSGTLGTTELRRLFGDGRRRLEVVAKAEDADRLLLTQERYDEFPDLWVTNTDFGDPHRISDVNPQIADYAWGSAELVEWSSADGAPLQGVLIKPGNYQPGTRYPVLVYYYRFSSQRLNLFNEPVVNHRPSFPVYASNGYAVFLPDIRFEVGRPGFSATKCLVPGVQKLVDMGVADPKAIGLHGHSWSGYQTAFVVTQTDIFAAAVAGAPVSNMTSAYSGIRWGTGLARQFQYEKTQSRIGGSLWEYPERYIENSPVFFADRINTPLLIQHGDEDGAVPWYQSIELYLACRRLEKNCIFLQYRGEPHHLKKYANKLDYSIKMKEFFDHWLKGAPAPEWMTDGVPYNGK
jgi:dipeptidyl aminopeptidase/acylaminoacyl peptidase